VSVAAWTTKPSWYVIATQDHMIARQFQRAFAKAMNAKAPEVTSSHVAMLSKPDEVAAVIIEAAKAAAQLASR
jgi:pimeloyl-ACP methyl ester carboxylesterase